LIERLSIQKATITYLSDHIFNIFVCGLMTQRSHDSPKLVSINGTWQSDGNKNQEIEYMSGREYSKLERPIGT
jgi:hypothetical protein